MNELEAKAYKIALLWCELSQKILPDYKHVRLKKSGDPRKCHLFRYCYKLARETKGIIPDREYKLYITAQLHILKSINDGQIHALIDPVALTGPRAWKRWQVWKRRYDKQTQAPESADGLKVAESKIFRELDRTKEFLEKQFNGTPSLEDIKRCLREYTMIRWLTMGKVTPYYALLSPLIQKALDRGIEDVFLFDLSIYKVSITENVENYFKERFTNEF